MTVRSVGTETISFAGHAQEDGLLATLRFELAELEADIYHLCTHQLHAEYLYGRRQPFPLR